MKATLLTSDEVLTWTNKRCSPSAYLNRSKISGDFVSITAMDAKGLGLRITMTVEEARKLQAQLDVLKLRIPST